MRDDDAAHSVATRLRRRNDACCPAGEEARAAPTANRTGHVDLPKGTHLFDSASCPFTSELREHLQWEGRDFGEHDVEADPCALERLLSLVSPARVPVLVVDGRAVEIGWQGRTSLVGTAASCDLPGPASGDGRPR